MGHSLKNDLAVLNFEFDIRNTRDIFIYFYFKKRKKYSLKEIVYLELGKVIQIDTHNP